MNSRYDEMPQPKLAELLRQFSRPASGYDERRPPQPKLVPFGFSPRGTTPQIQLLTAA